MSFFFIGSLAYLGCLWQLRIYPALAYALENSAFDSSPFWSVSSSENMLISFASTDASLWLIAPLPSVSSVSKSLAAKAADEEANAIRAFSFRYFQYSDVLDVQNS